MKTIVVLGAGYAGLKTVVALQKKMRNEVKIILIDQNGERSCENSSEYIEWRVF